MNIAVVKNVRKALPFMLSILTILMLVSAIASAIAEENPYVYTEDLDDGTEDYFESIGETVRIHACSSNTPYYITVYDPNGNVEKTIGPINTALPWSGDYTDISDEYGWWTLRVDDAVGKYAIGQYFAIPDLTLGTIMAMVASFGMLAALGTTRRLRLQV